MRKITKAIMMALVACLLSCGGGDNTIDPGEVSTERIEVPDVTMLPDGGEKQVTVNANCTWVITVPASDTWLSVNPSSGTNTQAITISCMPNTTTNSRTSVVTISGKQRTTAFKVTQNAAEKVITLFRLDNITSNSADYSFSLSSVSDSTACGACFSTTNKEPTTSDTVSYGSRIGNKVNGKITNLSANTKYYVRAFVTNSSGPYYSPNDSITTDSDAPGQDDNKPPTY